MRLFSLLLFVLAPALMAGIIPVSYSMQNGEYTYVSGYGDNTYTSSNCPGCPADLSGGTGELTDGHVEPSFFSSEGGAYTKMVGWGGDPSITFEFGSAQTFGAVMLHLSDAHGAAGIYLPTSVDVTIGNTTLNFGLTPQSVYPTTLNEWHTMNVGGLTGSSVTVKMYHGGAWTFMDEAAFLTPEESAAAPEPSSWLMLAGAGLGLLLVSRRSREK